MARRAGRSTASGRLVAGPAWILVSILILGPLYWVMTSAFKGAREIIRTSPTPFPYHWVVSNFSSLFAATEYATYLRNSVEVAVATSLVTVIVATAAAYALYRLRVPGGRGIGSAILLSYMIPGTLLLVPVYRIMASLHLIDSLTSLVIVNVTFTAPFCVWLLHGFLDSVPRDLDEAAMIDGAGRARVMFEIVLPLLLPGLATIAMYAFVYSWTEFVFASQLGVSGNKKTLPVGLTDIVGSYNINWGWVMAGAVIASLPGIVFFSAAGRFFVRGLTQGAIK